MESPVLREIWQEGLAEGLAEGQAEGRREDVLSFVATRFEPSYSVTRELEARLRAVDSVPVLQRLVVEAARVGSLAEFLALLDRMGIEAPEKA